MSWYVREQILSRAQELSETNAKLDLLPMIPQDQNFDMSFWSTVLQKTEEDQWEYEGAYIPDRLSVCLMHFISDMYSAQSRSCSLLCLLLLNPTEQLTCPHVQHVTLACMSHKLAWLFAACNQESKRFSI